MPDDARIFVCYIPGLDRRRLDDQNTPYISQLLAEYPSCQIDTIPSTELVPTLLTGVGPAEHKVWQLSLKEQTPPLSPLGRLIRLLPETVTTTAQCFMHLIDSSNDLSAMPWWRRRQFNLHRMKYTRREDDPTCLEIMGGQTSIFQEIGREHASYFFCKQFDDMDRAIDRFPSAGKRLEFAEFYAFDLFSHWHLDQMDKIREKLTVVDGYVKRLHQRCQDAGVSLMLLVDHGQEPIHASVNIKQALKHSGVPREEYVYFCEVAAARFWFRTDRARTKITELLQKLEHTTVKDYKQMHEFGVCFDDTSFGELYCFADHGHTFFPHDFYNPIANLYLGINDPLLRARLFNARHRGNHGHLPNHPAEQGYLVMAEHGYEVAGASMRLTDFAPTVMSLLGKPTAEHMTGTPIFTRS